MGTGSSNNMNHKLLEINMLEQVVVGPVNPGKLFLMNRNLVVYHFLI